MSSSGIRVGAVVLALAIDEPALSASVRHAVLAHLHLAETPFAAEPSD